MQPLGHRNKVCKFADVGSKAVMYLLEFRAFL